MSKDKRVQRQELKKILASLSDEDKNQRSIKVAKNLEELLFSTHTPPLFQEDFVLGAFAPMNDEPFWPEFLNRRPNVNCAFPVDLAGESQMGFVSCPFWALMHQEQFGVELLVPPMKEPLVEPNIFLVPGLGFTSQGHRLGRGRGYYDRFLESRSGVKIGICYHDQLLSELAVSEHDQVMDIVVTDKDIYMTPKFSGSFKE